MNQQARIQLASQGVVANYIHELSVSGAVRRPALRRTPLKLGRVRSVHRRRRLK